MVRRLNTILEALRKSSKWFAFMVVLAGASPLALPAQTATEYEAKAAFLFNFIKFVRWPETVSAGRVDFVIATSSSSPFRSRLESLAGKQVHGRTVRVVTYTDSQFPNPCDVVVVDLVTWNKLPDELRDELRDRHVLSVGEEAEFANQGGVFTLLLVDEHLAFDINVGAARAAKLVISANLLRLAQLSRAEGSR